MHVSYCITFTSILMALFLFSVCKQQDASMPMNVVSTGTSHGNPVYQPVLEKPTEKAPKQGRGFQVHLNKILPKLV